MGGDEANLREQLLASYELQQIDLALRRLQRELAQLDDGSALRQEVAAQEARHQAAGRQVHELDQELLDTELQMKSKEGKQKDCEHKMYSGLVRNPKELADMQQEVGLLTAAVDRLADQALELMDRLEQARAQAQEAAADLKALQEQAAELQARYQSESARLQQELEAETAARKQAVGLLNAGLLRKYEELRARKGGVAVVKATNGLCGGCHISVPLDVLRRAHAAQDMVFCDSCGRLLLAEA